MECKEKGCDGTLDTSRLIIISAGVGTFCCNKCSRIHFKKGALVFAEKGSTKVFLESETEAILVNKAGKITSTFSVTIISNA